MKKFLPQLGFIEAGDAWVQKRNNGIIGLIINGDSFRMAFAHSLDKEPIVKEGRGLEALILALKEL